MVGAVMGVILIYSLWFIRQHPGEAKEIFKSLLKREIQLLFILSTEWWDFAGNTTRVRLRAGLSSGS